jgi:hypothetical protein
MELFRRKQSHVYLAVKAAFKFSQDWEQIDLLQRSHLDYHLKTGQTLSPQNRPTGIGRRRDCFTLP